MKSATTIIFLIAITLLGMLVFSINTLATDGQIPLCGESNDIVDIPCRMLTPPIVCGTYIYSIYDVDNNTIVDAQPLIQYDNTRYYDDLDLVDGEYQIVLCDETSREVRVKTKMIEILFLVLFGEIVILALAMIFKDYTLASIASIGLFVTGIYITINGISGMNNFMTLALGFGLIGIGAYLMLTVALDLLEN